jgi:hypothetical protein
MCQGYGFQIDCSDISSIPWDDSSDSTVRQMYQESSNQIGSAVPAFNSSATLPGGMYGLSFDSSDKMTREVTIAADQEGRFQVTNLFKSEPICGGNLSLHKCSLRHAVVEYGITLSNGILSLKGEGWQDDNVLSET